MVPQQDSGSDSSPTRSLQDSDQENRTVSSPLTMETSVDEEKPEKLMMTCRMAVKELPKPTEQRHSEKSARKRPCEVDVSGKKVDILLLWLNNIQ